MKTIFKHFLTLVFLLSFIGTSYSQPRPNSNPHNNPAATNANPTQNSISTLSVDGHNEIFIGIMGILLIGTAFYSLKKKRKFSS